MTSIPVDERAALVVLAHGVEPGDTSVGRLVARLGPVEVLDRVLRGASGLRNGPAIAARLARVDSDDAVRAADERGARIVTRFDREWPTQLDALGDATPLALWVVGAGDLRLLALRSVAVVGARACSAYGAEVAHGWCADLAAAGWTTVSGAAFGIDAAAHRGCLAGGGATIAVLACGVDVPYPRAHDALLARIADDGLIVSECPLGEAVRRQRFLSRNRLVAGLTRATLVVEAALRSGASVTARVATDLNRVVLAVPGPVDSPMSAGCHRLIRDGGALIAAEVADVLAAVDLEQAGRRPVTATAGQSGVPEALAARDRSVLEIVPRRGGIALPELAQRAGIDDHEALAALATLQALGLVREESGQWRTAPRPRA